MVRALYDRFQIRKKIIKRNHQVTTKLDHNDFGNNFEVIKKLF